MKSFLFFFVSSILFLGCNPEDFEINYSGPPTNFSYDDQFNAIQGDVLGGNIFDNDELKLPPYQLESYNLKSARGYPVSISQSGRINYSPPPEYFGRDTFAYTLLTLYENGEKRTESLAFVYLSIIEKKRSGHVTDPRDGQLYPTILLDDGKVWTAKNLNIDLEGSSVSSDGLQYGRLYTWSTAIDACPEGWRLPSLEEVEYIFDLNLVPAGPNQWGAEFIDFNYRAHFEGGFSGLDLADQRYWTSTANGDSTSAAYYHVSSGFGAFRIEGGGGIAGELQSVTNPSACRCVKDLE